MENTQSGNEKITYEQIAQEYAKLALENQYLLSALAQLRADRSNEQLDTLLRILVDKDKFSKKIVKLADWHVQKMLAKPKKSK